MTKNSLLNPQFENKKTNDWGNRKTSLTKEREEGGKIKRRNRNRETKKEKIRKANSKEGEKKKEDEKEKSIKSWQTLKMEKYWEIV